MMKHSQSFLVVCLCLLSIVVAVQASQKDSTSAPSSSTAISRTVNDLYPGLATGALSYAAASKLPEGILLRAGTLVIRNEELNERIAKAVQQMQPKLKKNALFVLEKIATVRLLLAEAKTEAAKSGNDISEKDEQTIIQNYLLTLAGTVKVSDEEIRNFYGSNTEMLGGASLAQVRPQIEQFLLQQKQQEFINQRIQTIGRRMQIEISASWLKVHAALAKDNPVDKARASGKPSLVDFGSTGCVPCDMMAPILDTLKEKYKGKLNVLFVHVGQEPILAERYHVQSIPVQIFFNKAGKEVFRHVGFFPKADILAKWKQFGLNLEE